MQSNFIKNLLNDKQLAVKAEKEYMSDMNNYLAVHATAYLPKTNKNGQKYIPSTAMANDYEHCRSTIHTTLNHIVTGHAYGDWSEMPYAIMTSLNDLIKENNIPKEVSAVDTYFSVHPDKGLILPPNHRIVMPADNIPAGKLYEIQGNRTLYKSDDFSETEEKQLIERMSYMDKQLYNKYATGELADYEIEAELRTLGETGTKLYESTKDKKAFLRGLFENKRNTMLSTAARNIAMNATAEQMGFKTIRNIGDFSETLCAVERTAELHNILGNSSNKGHSNSMYSALENIPSGIHSLFYGNRFFNNKGILNYTGNLKELAQELTSCEEIPYKDTIIRALSNNKSLNIYDMFTTRFEHSKIFFNDRYKNFQSLKDWDKNADETIRRYCNKQQKAFEQWRKKISNLPEYKEFINTLRSWQIQRLAANSKEL